MTKEQKARAKELDGILRQASASLLREIILKEYIKIHSINMREAIREDITRTIKQA